MGVIWGYIGMMEKENGNYYSILGLYKGYTGIMEKKKETTLIMRKP